MIFLLGFVVRAVFIFLDYSWDVNSHIAWSEDILRFGFSGFYDHISTNVFSTPYPNYPPFTIFLFALFNLFYQFGSWIVWQLNILIPAFPSKLVFIMQEKFVLAGFLKIPAILADLGIAYLIYLFAKKKSYLFPSLILFNPAFFYNSAYWGQIESIPIFFTLASVYFLFYKKSLFFGSLAFSLALLSKQTAIIFFPLFLILVYKEYKIKGVFKSLPISLILFFLAFVPFYGGKINLFIYPWTTYYEKILTVSGLSFVSNRAFNFWILISHFQHLPDSVNSLFGLSFRNWGSLISGILSLPVFYFLIRKKPELQRSAYAFFLVGYLAFESLTRIHERHFLQVLPLLLILSIKNRNFLKYFLALSLFHFANLYHSWLIPYNKNIEVLVRSPYYQYPFIILGLMIFVYFYIDFLKREKLKGQNRVGLH